MGGSKPKALCWNKDTYFAKVYLDSIGVVGKGFGQKFAFSTILFFLPGEVLASVQGNNEVGLWNMESQFRQLVLWASSSPLLSTNQSNSQSVTAMQSIHNHEMNVLITGNYLIYKGSQQFLSYF